MGKRPYDGSVMAQISNPNSTKVHGAHNFFFFHISPIDKVRSLLTCDPHVSVRFEYHPCRVESQRTHTALYTLSRYDRHSHVRLRSRSYAPQSFHTPGTPNEEKRTQIPKAAPATVLHTMLWYRIAKREMVWNRRPVCGTAPSELG